MTRSLIIAAVVAAFVFALRLDRYRRNVDRVVILTIDTVRADHLPFLGYPRPTAKAMSMLSEEGFLFERAYAASPDFALSLRGIATSRNAFDAASPAARPLLERLRDAGFEVAAFSDDPDFAAVTGSVPFEPSSSLQAAVSDAARWFRSKARRRKVAVWLHMNGTQEAMSTSFVDDLAPIGPELRRHLVESQGLPADDNGSPTRASLERVRFHDARILAVDRAIMKFFYATLNRKKPTVIVVAGCRGEAFGADDGTRLDEGLVRVPLIVWFSDDRGPGRRLQGLVRHIDVWPSIAGLALPVHRRLALHYQGRSFAGALQKKGGWAGTAAAYIERSSGASALVAGRRKLVHDGENWRLYDLEDDPLERRDLSGSDPGTLARMRRRLERFARAGR